MEVCFRSYESSAHKSTAMRSLPRVYEYLSDESKFPFESGSTIMKDIVRRTDSTSSLSRTCRAEHQVLLIAFE